MGTAQKKEMNTEEITRFFVELRVGKKFTACFEGEGYAVDVVLTGKGFGGKEASSRLERVFFEDSGTPYRYFLELTANGWLIKSEDENVLAREPNFRKGLRVERVGCREVI